MIMEVKAMQKLFGVLVVSGIILFGVFESKAIAGGCNLSVINATNVSQTIKVNGKEVATIPARSSDILFGVVNCEGGDTINWTTGHLYGKGLWPQDRKGKTFAITITK